jgi:small-conductance mechanosensitive channel
MMTKISFSKNWYFLFFIVFNQVIWSQTNTFNFEQTEREIHKISHTVDTYKSLLAKKNIDIDSLNTYLLQLYVDRDSVLSKSISIQNSIQNTNSLLTTLDPANKLGIEEPENITNQRKELSAQIGTLTEFLQTANSLLIRIDDLSSQFSKLKTTQFISKLKKRTSTPFSKKVWISAAKDFKVGVKIITDHLTDFWKRLWISSDRFLNIIILIISWVLAFLAYKAPHTAVWKKIILFLRKETPTTVIQKKMRMLSKPLIHFCLALLTGGLLYWGFIETDLIVPIAKPFIFRIWLGSAILVFIWYTTATAFQPTKSYWMGFSVSEGNTFKVRTIFVLFFLIFVIDRIVSSSFLIVNAGVELLMVQAIISNTIFAVLLFLFFNKNLWQINNESTAKKTVIKIVDNKISVNKPLLLLEIVLFLGKGFAIILLGFVMLGYIRLADFIFHRIMLFSIFIFLFYSIRVFTFWSLEKLTDTKLDDQENEVSYKNIVTNTIVYEDYNADKKLLINFWVKMLIDFTLILFAIPVFLYLIGFDWLEVDHSLLIMVSGFTVGAITISLKNIFTGIFIFVLIIVFTRILTSFLTKKFKQIDQVSSGVNNTIVTMISYLGILMAFLAALPVVGVSFSKLSMIVGALSVGIGFGLKNIVNDFVSGLILLFERPIKIGDRIEVQSGSGYVEKIQARATIIRTYDMATIIVPNSELISLSFLNWFYKGKQGRFNLAVGVEYGADPKLVEQLMLQCAHEHKLVLKIPAPIVVWLSFGDSSLNFELRAFVANYDDSRVVKSDLHFKIFEKFKAAGISMPFPQRDLNIKNAIQIVEDKTKNNAIEDDPMQK